MRIRLRERRPETADVMSFIFDLGGQSYEYLPGQFAFLELDELAFPDERGKRRHFTISSSPTEKDILMFTIRMRGSGFKETLRNAPLGYEVTVETPRGRFVLPEVEGRRHIFLAGGIGITPFRSILRNAADRNAPIQALMLYFSRSAADLIFRRELEGIAGQMPTFSLVPVLSEPEPDWRGEQGEFSERLLRRYVPDLEPCLFWISGSPPMVAALKDLIRQIGIPEESLHTDSFTGY
ncbi:MAG: FAD-dependent oxidoreductase [candidate division NC10 bacterium]|nr:FAD-dependent oxidoreductase [candidate division NC10 bacterium]